MNEPSTRWGASVSDWQALAKCFPSGDLLPVVSNPDAQIKKGSTLKSLGKVPSRYARTEDDLTGLIVNAVVGFPDWPNFVASDADLLRWRKEADYGAFLQTRSVRALDCDVSDPGLAAALQCFIGDFLDLALPTRFRANSPKWLQVFRLPDVSLPKRAIVFGDDVGALELLGTGNGFVAAGAHLDRKLGYTGARYEWAGGIPSGVPEISLGMLNELWVALHKEFGIEYVEGQNRTGTAAKARRKAPTLDKPDEVNDALHAKGLVLDYAGGGSVIACPWEHEHTGGETGDGSTVYFPAGTNGYERGHFRCLHSHCGHRTDGEFLLALGLDLDVLNEITIEEVAEATGGVVTKEGPALRRDKKGKIEPTIGNLYAALVSPHWCGWDIRLDHFQSAIVYRPVDRVNGTGVGAYAPFSDTCYTRARIDLESRGFKPIGREQIRDAVCLVAEDNAYDSAVDWIDGLVWDGVPRVERFLVDYMRVPSSDYARAVSRYMWTALAGRVLEPGCKADMVPTFIGPQGLRKSTLVGLMAPFDEYAGAISFDATETDNVRKMQGKLVVEIEELKGLHSRDAEHIKAFLSKQCDEWIPKYKEFAIKPKRRCLFFGTGNGDALGEGFLSDATGHRRWLPLHVPAKIDTDAVTRDRLQLWAEGRELFLKGGVAWEDAERLANDEHGKFVMGDTWEEPVAMWLASKELDGVVNSARGDLTLGVVASGALGLSAVNVGRKESLRLASVLRKFGFSPATTSRKENGFWISVSVWRQKTR